MPRRKKQSTTDCALDRSALLVERLRLIKTRHQELILRPRDGLMNQCASEDDGFEDFEEAEELQLLESYGYAQ
jgi:hypothetical protein